MFVLHNADDYGNLAILIIRYQQITSRAPKRHRSPLVQSWWHLLHQRTMMKNLPKAMGNLS